MVLGGAIGATNFLDLPLPQTVDYNVLGEPSWSCRTVTTAGYRAAD